MSNRGLWLEGGTTFPDRTTRLIAVALAIGWFALIAARNGPAPFTSRDQCGSDPWDFLHLGELVDLHSLAFLVESHCTNARYSSDGWIELSFGGGRVDVQLQRVEIGGTTHFKIVSIGGVSAP